MKTIFIPIFIFCILCGSPPNEVTAQNTALNVELRFGLNLNLYNFNPFTSKNQKFSGLKVFGTAIVAGQISPELRSNYAATIAIYNKSLGNNMNPLISDIQIDFINSLSLGVGWGKGAIWQRDFWKNEQPMVPYSKYLRTMNQAPFYNLNHNFRNAAFLGTNFIINNHGRNQTCGSIALTFGDFSLNYYNDGSFPFSTTILYLDQK